MSLFLPPPIDNAERELLLRADAWRRRNISAAMTPEDVQAVHREHGVDFATAVLYTHFVAVLPMDFHASQRAELPTTGETPRLAIAPGAFHEHYPQLGADGRSVCENAKQRGWESCVIPTRGLGTLEENATTIINWFDARPSESFAVIAISKGAADVRVALARRPDLWRQIHGWICVSGILSGTPIANWLLERKRFWLTTKLVLWYWNRPRGSLAELCHQSDALGDVDGDAEMMLVRRPIQLVGFPLRKHLSSWRSRLWHRRLAAHGPTDSVIWLSDLLAQRTTVVPVWGIDHYMRSSSEVAAICTRLVSLLAQPSTAEAVA